MVFKNIKYTEIKQCTLICFLNAKPNMYHFRNEVEYLTIKKGKVKK